MSPEVSFEEVIIKSEPSPEPEPEQKQALKELETLELPLNSSPIKSLFNEVVTSNDILLATSVEEMLKTAERYIIDNRPDDEIRLFFRNRDLIKEDLTIDFGSDSQPAFQHDLVFSHRAKPLNFIVVKEGLQGLKEIMSRDIIWSRLLQSKTLDQQANIFQNLFRFALHHEHGHALNSISLQEKTGILPAAMETKFTPPGAHFLEELSAEGFAYLGLLRDEMEGRTQGTSLFLELWEQRRTLGLEYANNQKLSEKQKPSAYRGFGSFLEFLQNQDKPLNASPTTENSIALVNEYLKTREGKKELEEAKTYDQFASENRFKIELGISTIIYLIDPTNSVHPDETVANLKKIIAIKEEIIKHSPFKEHLESENYSLSSAFKSAKDKLDAKLNNTNPSK